MTLSGKALAAWVGGASVLTLALVGAGLLAFTSFSLFPKEKVGESVVAKPASEVRRVPMVTVAAPKGVRVYKPEAKRKLNLPPAVIANKDEQVISTAVVKSTSRPHTVTTTINTETGEAQSFVRADPYPWIAFESRGEIGLSAGYKYRYRHAAGFSGSPVATVGRLDVRQDFLQVKALHVGVRASVDTDGDAYAGVGLTYKW